MNSPQHDIYDFIVIGSGFGGSVSAMRLTEKGYSVLVLERGKRFRDQDFPVTNWNLFKYLWFPPLRFFGILQMSIFNDIWVLHGSGVGGGSLMYANVLMEPSDKMFTAPAWSHLADWKTVLSPHYATAKRMLGVTTNPLLWPADHALAEIAEELGTADTFRPAEVAVYFSDPDQEGDLVPDPFFGGEGPQRRGCIHCGGCMVGCRHNAKNTLVKNYLYFAEKWGAEVLAEKQVMNIQPLPANQADGTRYEVIYQSSTGVVLKPEQTIRARNIIVAAGSLGTTRLLFRCRDETQTLPDISSKLGNMVRTNSEALLGITSRERSIDHSKGIAITSVFMADEVTAIEPVRHPDKASFMRNTALPLIDVAGKSFSMRILTMLWTIIRHPIDFLHSRFFLAGRCVQPYYWSCKPKTT